MMAAPKNRDRAKDQPDNDRRVLRKEDEWLQDEREHRWIDVATVRRHVDVLSVAHCIRRTIEMAKVFRPGLEVANQ